MRTLIVGCGYVGLPLGVELARRGHEVFGLRRSGRSDAEMKTAKIHPLVGDITKPETLRALPHDFDWVVNLVSSTGGAQEYRAVYLEGMRHLIDWLGVRPPRQFVYTSSTGVYGQKDGSLVTEDSPAQPTSGTGAILVETERLLFDAVKARDFPAVVLRVAGIYGPGRGYLFRQYLRGEARIAGEGRRILNMIHRDDLLGVILAALEVGQPGEVYNVVDDEPIMEIEFWKWISQALKKPMPLQIEASAPHSPKGRATHKRVSNTKLKSRLAYQFLYPTFREGYRPEIEGFLNASDTDQ